MMERLEENSKIFLLYYFMDIFEKFQKTYRQIWRSTDVLKRMRIETEDNIKEFLRK